MKVRQTLILTFLGVVAVLGWQAYQSFFPPENKLNLVFTAEVAGQPLMRNQFAYDNPGGDGQFRIRDFRFFLSDVQLHQGQGGEIYKVPDSYHLARFDNAQNAYVLALDKIPLHDIEKITFAIGVDAEANTSIEVKGDLDPNSQMAWNWKVGYKFVVFEGSMQLNDQHRPLVYHVGFSENMRRLNYALPDPLALSETSQLEFAVDVMKLFDSNSTVDMAQLSSVKFDKNDTRMLAENYRTMISLQTQ